MAGYVIIDVEITDQSLFAQYASESWESSKPRAAGTSCAAAPPRA